MQRNAVLPTRKNLRTRNFKKSSSKLPATHFVCVWTEVQKKKKQVFIGLMLYSTRELNEGIWIMEMSFAERAESVGAGHHEPSAPGGFGETWHNVYKWSGWTHTSAYTPRLQSTTNSVKLMQNLIRTVWEQEGQEKTDAEASADVSRYQCCNLQNELKMALSTCASFSTASDGLTSISSQFGRRSDKCMREKQIFASSDQTLVTKASVS